MLTDAVAGAAGVGTTVLPHDRDLPARKLWIAFAVGSTGTLVVDDGARRALLERAAPRCSRPASSRCNGSFDADDAVELATPDGGCSPRAWSRVDAATAKDIAGRRSDDLPDGTPPGSSTATTSWSALETRRLSSRWIRRVPGLTWPFGRRRPARSLVGLLQQLVTWRRPRGPGRAGSGSPRGGPGPRRSSQACSTSSMRLSTDSPVSSDMPLALA